MLLLLYYRFHKRVAIQVPALNLKAAHGIADSVDFTIPTMHPNWTPSAYAAFIIPKNDRSQKDKSVSLGKK